MRTDEITCGWVDDFGSECGEPAHVEDKITLRDRLMAGKVILCPKHKAAHNRKAAEIRANMSRGSSRVGKHA